MLEADKIRTSHIFLKEEKSIIYFQGYINVHTHFLFSFGAISFVFPHLSMAPFMFPIAAPILLVQMKLINTICLDRYRARSLVQTQQLEPLHTGAAPHYLRWRRLLEGKKQVSIKT